MAAQNIKKQFLSIAHGPVMRILGACLSLTLLLTSGCALCNRCDDFACECRDNYRGYAAWTHWQPVYAGICYETDFGAGFQAGYSNMASRGNNQIPESAPRKYKSVFYHSETGREQMQAWFDGYSHGVIVAEQEGVDQWCRTASKETPTVSRVRAPLHRDSIRTAAARDGEWQSTAANSTNNLTPIPSTLGASGIVEPEDQEPDVEDPSQPFAPSFSPSARGE